MTFFFLEICIIISLSVETTSRSLINGECLSLSLHDTFGDGWDNAALVIESPSGHVSWLKPECSSKPTVLTECFNEDGIYFLAVKSTEGSLPKNYWEIFWTITVLGVDLDWDSFKGGFNTTLGLHYDLAKRTWQLVYDENILTEPPNFNAWTCGFNNLQYDYTDTCRAKSSSSLKHVAHHDAVYESAVVQVVSEGSIGLRQPRLIGRKSIKKTDHRKRKLSQNLDILQNRKLSNISFPLGTKSTTSKAESILNNVKNRMIKSSTIAKMQSTTDIKVVMHDSTGKGWKTYTYDSMSFQISDYSKTVLIAYGALDKGVYTGFCEYCFPDGSYYFRLLRNGQDDATTTAAEWAFCNTKGSSMQELSFHIIGGVCYPDALISVEALCKGQRFSLVTVAGTLALSGVTTELFNAVDARAVAKSLENTVYGWSANDIDVQVVSLDPRDASASSGSTSDRNTLRARSLASFNYELKYSTIFISEIVYGIDGANYDALTALAAELQNEISEALSSGAFVASIKQIAAKDDLVELSGVTATAYRSFSVQNVEHVGSLEMEVTMETTAGQMNTAMSSDASRGKDQDGAAAVVVLQDAYDVKLFLSVFGLGFFAFVGLVGRLFTSRRQRDGDDEEESEKASRVVLPIEREAVSIDYLVSPHDMRKPVML